MPFTSGFICEDTLVVTGDLVGVELRLPWMRSLPWRCIRRIAVKLDGMEAAPSQLRLRSDGRDVSVGSLASLDGYWVVGTPIRVWVPHVRTKLDDDIALSVEVSLLIPYISGTDGPPDFTAVGTTRLRPQQEV